MLYLTFNKLRYFPINLCPLNMNRINVNYFELKF